MAIGNIDSVSSMLARMTPQQRQQFAMMHHDDPIMVSLAKFVNDVEQEKAQAMRGQQLMGRGPMPPVVQQEIAQMAPPQQMAMLPEEVGIGALPAPNMERMAGGGITGEDDGVERYAERGYTGPYTAGDVLGELPGYAPATSPMLPQAGSGEDEKLIPRLLRQYQENTKKELAAKIKAKMEMGTATKEDIKWFQANAPKLSEAGSAAATPSIEGMLDPTTGRAVKTSMPAAAAATAVPAPAPATPRPSGGAPNIIPAAPSRYTQSPLDIFQSALEQTPLMDPNASQREALIASLQKEPQEALAEFEKSRKKPEELYKGREERYAKREAELAKESETNAGIALLTAAGAMLEPGGLAAGVSRAIKTAVPQYVAGLDKLKAAQERIQEGRDLLEERRQAYDDLTTQERLRLKREGNKAIAEGNKIALDAQDKLQQLRYGIAGKAAEATEARRKTEIEQEGRERVARIGANAPSEKERIAAALGGGNLEVGLRKFTEITAGKFNPQQAYATYMDNWQKSASANPMFAETYPMMSFSQFLGSMTIPTQGGGGATQPGEVRPRPGVQ